MRTTAKPLWGVVFASAVLLAVSGGSRVVHGQAEHVRWDIVSLDFTTTPATASAGGVAFASARNPNTLKIKLTGSGTFVSPASGAPTGAVTGGGKWETFNGAVSTGKGTYVVTRLASWEFASLQTPGVIDTIGSNAVNGNAVLRIQYSDGSKGTLGIGCHGPGAPPGIVEGIIATKDFVTYWDAEAPSPGVDKNRTGFHIE